GFMRLDLHDAAGGVLAEQRALRTAVDFDAGRIVKLQQRVQIAGIEDAVDRNTDAGVYGLVDARITDTARIKHGSRPVDRAHRLDSHVRGHARQVGHVLDEQLVQLFRTERGHGNRRVLDGFLAQRRSDDHGFDAGRLFRRLRRGRRRVRLRGSGPRERGQPAQGTTAQYPLANLHFIPLRFLARTPVVISRRYWSRERFGN